MILDVIQSKLATLREMNNNGNINYVEMDVILSELEILSKILASPTTYKVERVGHGLINIKMSFGNFIDDGLNIEF